MDNISSERVFSSLFALLTRKDNNCTWKLLCAKFCIADLCYYISKSLFEYNFRRGLKISPIQMNLFIIFMNGLSILFDMTRGGGRIRSVETKVKLNGI